jgi:hypothetical protein
VMFKLLSVGRHAMARHFQWSHWRTWCGGATFLQRRKRIVIYRDTKLMTFDDILITQVHQNPIRIRCPRPALHFCLTFFDWLFSWVYAASTKVWY